MSATLLIKKAAVEGVRVKLESDNKLKVCGPAEARAKWLPILREHKSELLAELTTSGRKTARPQDRQGGGVGASRAEADTVVVTVLAGANPFATAAELIRVAREKATPGCSYRFRLVDQADADRRNAQAVRDGLADRFCSCGALATFAWPGDNGRLVWFCQDCAPTRGRPQ